MKCKESTCDEEGTEKVMRGSEVWYYCKPHYNWWIEIMQALGI